MFIAAEATSLQPRDQLLERDPRNPYAAFVTTLTKFHVPREFIDPSLVTIDVDAGPITVYYPLPRGLILAAQVFTEVGDGLVHNTYQVQIGPAEAAANPDSAASFVTTLYNLGKRKERAGALTSTNHITAAGMSRDVSLWISRGNEVDLNISTAFGENLMATARYTKQGVNFIRKKGVHRSTLTAIRKSIPESISIAAASRRLFTNLKPWFIADEGYVEAVPFGNITVPIPYYL